MRLRVNFALVRLMLALICVGAHADETDNFTLRNARLQDAGTQLDHKMNEAIRRAVNSANQPSLFKLMGHKCDRAVIESALRNQVAKSTKVDGVFREESDLSIWARTSPQVERVEVEFARSIYGTGTLSDRFNVSSNKRIIYLAPTLQVYGQRVGADKLSHFIREGLKYFDEDRKGGERAALHMGEETELGMLGKGVTGVKSYADLAANYAGYRFWKKVMTIGDADSYLACDPKTGRFSAQKNFSFSEYVNPAWDEALNCSDYSPDLAKQVRQNLKKMKVGCPVQAGVCLRLIQYRGWEHFVNPTCSLTAQRVPESNPDMRH